MFGRKKLLTKAIAGLNEALGLLSQRNLLLDETTASQAQTMALLDQSMGLLHRAIAVSDNWQRLYEESTQEKAPQVAELGLREQFPLNGWVN
jgi:hypothetical protein